MTKIGVFDSGIGGKAMALAIEKALPKDRITRVNDRKHAPYGNKTPDQLFSFVEPILQKLAEDNDVIVVACNTVCTTIIWRLREVIPVPLVAMEPMVKPAAALTKSKVIAVCATPATLASPRYHHLKERFAKTIKVVEPDCSDWAAMMEANTVSRQTIAKRIEPALRAGADVIVLGCTHYHWIETLIKEIAGERAAVLQPEQPVIEQLKRVIGELGLPA